MKVMVQRYVSKFFHSNPQITGVATNLKTLHICVFPGMDDMIMDEVKQFSIYVKTLGKEGQVTDFQSLFF